MTVRSSVNTIKSMLQDIKNKFYEAAHLNNLSANENTTLPEYVEIFENRQNSGWEYPPEWIDVHEVLENDTYDTTAYRYGRAVILLLNNQETTTFKLSSGSNSIPKAVKTSDGAFYTYANNGSSVTHTWNTGNEKTCYAIFYYNKTSANPCYSTTLPSNVLYVYIDSSSFNFANDYSPTYSTHQYWQGLECTKESVMNCTGCLKQTALEYVYLPFNKENSIVNNCIIEDSMFLKYFYASKLNPSYVPYNVNYFNYSNVDWASYNNGAIAYSPQYTYIEGIIDLSGYTSDTAVSLFYNARNNINVKVKLPNAPVNCYLGKECVSLLKPSTWEYMAENAPTVQSRTFTLNSYGYASLKAAGNAYQTLKNKGWVIQ